MSLNSWAHLLFRWPWTFFVNLYRIRKRIQKYLFPKIKRALVELCRLWISASIKLNGIRRKSASTPCRPRIIYGNKYSWIHPRIPPPNYTAVVVRLRNGVLYTPVPVLGQGFHEDNILHVKAARNTMNDGNYNKVAKQTQYPNWNSLLEYETQFNAVKETNSWKDTFLAATQAPPPCATQFLLLWQPVNSLTFQFALDIFSQTELN